MVKERSLARTILVNFWNSLKPRNVWGTHIGTDYNGTKYYESTLTESSRKQRPPRWFVPKATGDFEQDIPPEWESWLRYRRKEAPTEEEVNNNLRKALLVRQKAMESEKSTPKFQPTEDTSEFPKYDDMESMPGDSIRKERYQRLNEGRTDLK